MKLKLPKTKIGTVIRLFFATRRLGKQKANDAKVVKDWLADEENKKQVVSISQIFNQHFKGGWFSLVQVMNTTNYKTVPEAMRILNILKLSGCLIAEIRGERELYKIVLGDDQREILLIQQRKKLEKQIEDIDNQLSQIKAKKDKS